MQSRRVGRVTVALSLIVLGAGLLADNLLGTGYSDWLWRLWPVVLIGLGVEYLVRSRTAADGTGGLSLDVGAIAVLLVVVLILGTLRLARGIALWLPPGGSSLSVAAEKTAVLDLGDVRALQVELDVGRMVVTGDSPDGRVHARARVLTPVLLPAEAARLAEDLALEVQQAPLPTIRANLDPARGPGPFRWWAVKLELTVQVPPGVDLTLSGHAGSIAASDLEGNVSVRLDAGEVVLARIRGNATVRTDAATITAEAITGTLEASTGPGSIRAVRFGGGRLTSEVGRIQAEDWQGPLALSSQTGSITASTGFPVTGDLEVQTRIGSVELVLPESSRAAFDLRTRVGSLEVPPQLTVVRHGTGGEARGTLGDGQARVWVETDTGRIALRLR
ncbi:MAG: DUF4097 family beta strand repeat-containing protein [Firmicutes bacterium]|nr:DUF4097 family beta strand repeat-containing protein [Bacillota bacterium]